MYCLGVESEEEHAPVTEAAEKEDESKETEEETDKKPVPEEPEVPAVVSEIPQPSEEAVPTTGHPLFPHLPSSSTKSPAIDDRIGEDDEENTTAKLSASSTTEAPVTSAPSTTTVASQQQQPITPPPYGHAPEYEDEYDEEEVFGPGTCRYAGKLYVSAQQIPRDDPCDFCFCFRSDIICLQQSCPPPIAGCHEEPISGFCCPRYECPVSMAAVLNITTSTTTTSTTLPPHFLHYSHGEAVKHTGCLINGRSYRVGEQIESTSGPCISCT